jgi:hypothetical protein
MIDWQLIHFLDMDHGDEGDRNKNKIWLFLTGNRFFSFFFSAMISMPNGSFQFVFDLNRNAIIGTIAIIIRAILNTNNNSMPSYLRKTCGIQYGRLDRHEGQYTEINPIRLVSSGLSSDHRGFALTPSSSLPILFKRILNKL